MSLRGRAVRIARAAFEEGRAEAQRTTGYPSQQSPEGRWGRVTLQGRIRSDSGVPGEVAVSIRGGVEMFYAYSVDGTEIGPQEEVVVVEYKPPRTVTVARVDGRERGQS